MQIWGTGGYECKALVPSAHVKWAKSFPKSQPGKHMIPFAMVECCTLFFCNYNGLICVGWVRLAYQSLIYWILVSAVHLEEQQYLAGWVGLWFHCNQDSFVKILLLSGAWGFWEEEVFLPPPPPPFFFSCMGGFSLFHPLGYYLCSPLISCLSLYFSTLWKFLSVWPGVCLADHIVSEGPAFVAWFWQCWAVSWDVIKTLRTGCLLHGKGMLDGAGIWGCQFGQGWRQRARDRDISFHL